MAIPPPVADYLPGSMVITGPEKFSDMIRIMKGGFVGGHHWKTEKLKMADDLKL